jgi:hypothetical protein
MITKQNILERAKEWGLRPEIVEKDYVLGWLLAGNRRSKRATVLCAQPSDRRISPDPSSRAL